MAEEALHAVLTDARRGTLSVVVNATFADAAAEYLRYVEDVRQIDPATVKDYRGVIEGYLIDEFGSQSITTISPDAIDAYKERLIAESRLSNRVIVRHLTVLHGVFKRAKRVWGLTFNPASADLVERPQMVYTGEFDTYNGDEVELLAASAADAQDATVYRVAAYTGLRLGELLALRWKDVDLVGGLMHVRRNYTDNREKIPKGKRVRSVPMTGAVVDALARLKDRGHLTDDDDLVFINTAGGTWLRGRCGGATTGRSRRRGCVRSASTTCAIASARWRSLCSTLTPSSHTWATSTTRPRRDISITGPGPRTHAGSSGHSGDRVPKRVPN